MKRTWLSLLGAGLLLAGSSRAAVVTWEIEGVVQGVFTYGQPQPPPPGEAGDPILTSLGVTVGAPSHLRLSIDTTASDFDADPNRGAYLRAVLAYEYSAGDYHVALEASPRGGVVVFNARSEFGGAYPEGMVAGAGSGSALTDLYANPSVFMQLIASVPGTFADTSLPIEPSPLENFYPFGPVGPFPFGSYFELHGDSSLGEPIQIANSLTSWVVVPEPGLAVLLGMAALGLVRRRVSGRGEASSGPTSSNRRAAASWREPAERGPA